MNAIGVIPARLGSTRLAQKVLLDIAGKPMLRHVWESAKRASLLDDIIIATDDEAVMKAAQRFGAKVVLTSTAHKTGTDRITEVVNPLDVKVVVNIQADEPLIHPAMINALASELLNNPNLVMATLAKRITSEKDIHDPNIVKVVMDKEGFALYFSRASIPYNRRAESGLFMTQSHYKHIGIYAYTKDFLFTYTNMPLSKLEQIEKLEQLRVLENGYKIKVIETTYDTISIDTQEDLDRVRGLWESNKQHDKPNPDK
jgi:3-deoxy-manno-octulosonate cytidylyltransferase (CMP-KDO synthetase)